VHNCIAIKAAERERTCENASILELELEMGSADFLG